MAVPQDIRSVGRPKNTVVVDRGGSGPLRYAVVERVGCKRKGTRNLPVNGATIGHIINGRYVAKDKGKAPVARTEPDIKAWADAEIVCQEGSEIFDELLGIFGAADATNLYVMACLRVARPGVACRGMRAAYEDSFLSELVPGAELSKNKVSDLLEQTGRAYSKIVAFMRARAAGVAADHRIAIDGTLKQDTSSVNDLSRFSRKARVKGTRDISLLYAFGTDSAEPICGKAYPGNVIDSVAYQDFLDECDIQRGVLIGDKAFTQKAARQAFDRNPDLHWLNPIRRSDRRIQDHDMYGWQGRLDGLGRDVLFKKVALQGGNLLYSFYDRARAEKEEADWFKHAKGPFDGAKAAKARQKFGTIVFESDLDLEPGKVWAMYQTRWEIECVFDYYKCALDLDQTRVVSDASVIGSEFVNFLSSVITTRLIKRFDSAGLLEKMTYGQIMDELRSGRKVRLEEGGPWMLARTTVHARQTFTKLGLIEDEPDASKPKRGRPKGSGKKPRAASA